MQIAKGVINFPSQNPNGRRFILFNSKRVSTELTNVVRGSNIQSRGKTYAASVPSDDPKAEKGSKRVSKDERKAMVEAFVNKYRATNAGKFPSASDTKKQAGGSHYTVRKIIQELEYNSRISPSENRNENLLKKESAKKKESLAEIEEVSISQGTADARLQSKTPRVSSLEISGDLGNKRSKAKEGLQTNTLVEKTFSEEAVKSQTTATPLDVVATESHLQTGKTIEVSHQVLETPEEGSKDEFSAENPQNIVGIKHGPPQDQGPLAADNIATDMFTKQTNDEELHKKTTIWGNLKSLADGLVNMWKKL